MMRTILLFIPALFLLVANAQVTADFKQHITYLASDELKGRFTGSKEERLAAQYVIEQFKAAGITNPTGNLKDKKYLQQFVYHPTIDSQKTTLKGNNIVAYINNGAKKTVVLGAHYDHLGMGDPHHSTYRGEPAVHNGADDNASGVAMIVELAQKLKQSDYKNSNYLIICFSGEEEGLYGSKWYVEHPLVDTSKISYMLNFDMVGRVDSNKIVISGVGTSPSWGMAMHSIQSPLHLKTTESGVGPSDHTSFYLKNVPVLHFFSGQHKDYHKPSDDEEKINYKGMEDIFNYVVKLIGNLDKNDKLAFTKTKEENNENTPKFKVTLGVMPDYTFEGKGMRIDGVTDGKPADKAGLKQGDVVVQLGEIEVADMMTYMKALAAFKKGDKTKVKVKRGSEVIEKEVEF